MLYHYTTGAPCVRRPPSDNIRVFSLPLPFPRPGPGSFSAGQERQRGARRVWHGAARCRAPGSIRSSLRTGKFPRRRPQRSRRLASSVRSSRGAPGRPHGTGGRQLLPGRPCLRSAPADPGPLPRRAEPSGREGTRTRTGTRRAGTYGTTRRRRGRPSGLGNLHRPDRCRPRSGDVVRSIP